MNRKQLQENAHSPSFTYGNLVELVTAIRAQSLTGSDRAQLDRAFNANDSILFLGALGAAELRGRIDFRMQGGDVNTPIPDLDSDSSIGGPGQAGGYFQPDRGGVRVGVDTYTRLMRGTPSTQDGNIITHEILHRGFGMLRRASQQYSELRTMLPQDLFGAWADGWGQIDYSKFPMTTIVDQTTQTTNPRLQINPEHCMIYAMTAPFNDWADRMFIQTVPQLPWGARFFNSDWHSNFNDRYDDLTRDRPTTDVRRMRAYWRILYYNTERGCTRFLRTVLRQAVNMPSSPRPVARPGRGQGPGTPAPRPDQPQNTTRNISDVLGLQRSVNSFRSLDSSEFMQIANARTAAETVSAAQAVFQGKRVRLYNGQIMSGQEFVDIIESLANRQQTSTISYLLTTIEIR